MGDCETLPLGGVESPLKYHPCAGGARVVIAGGNITVECPGTLTVKAGKKAFSGPGGMGYGMPQLPRTVCVSCMLAAAKNAAPFAPKS